MIIKCTNILLEKDEIKIFHKLYLCNINCMNLYFSHFFTKMKVRYYRIISAIFH